MLDLLSRPFAEDHQRNQRQAGGQRGHQDRRQAFSSATHHQVAAERHALFPLQMLEVIDQQDAVPSGNPEDREEPHQRSQGHDPTTEEGSDHASH